MSFEEFHDGRPGGHFGYRNGTILAILNLCVTVMPPINFSSIGLRVWEEIEEFQDGLPGVPWRPSWISEWNNFSNFESLCHYDASHQISAQLDLGFRRRCHLKNFKMAAMAAILDIRME